MSAQGETTTPLAEVPCDAAAEPRRGSGFAAASEIYGDGQPASAVGSVIRQREASSACSTPPAGPPKLAQ